MVQGRVGAQHHPSEGRGLSRRRRPTHRADVGDRARLLIRLDAITDADGVPLDRRALERWFPVLRSGDEPLRESAGASIVLDRFGWELHLGDTGASHEGDHPGDEFVGLAVRDGVEVRIVDTGRHDVDLRRAGIAELDEAARAGALLGAVVEAFEIAVR